jgi:two-component system CheB/CheR fusion protein
MVFIIVQHLDPTHESMMVELLSSATAMPVLQAADDMEIALDNVYIIPPGAYLALAGNRLKLSAPLARHGARMPFDFLLSSLAQEAGPRAICVVLSGTGLDGTIGLAAIKAAGGLVIAQDPADAKFDGMPRSAIDTGKVDLVLPVEDIAGALTRHRDSVAGLEQSGLQDIVAFLKSSARHDFTLYKPGTLERRIDRRMSMAGFSATQTSDYLALLKSDAEEANALAEDLLINVTSFFRDKAIFELVASTAIAELVNNAGGNPIRVWVAGCSTGEETYSLAMLFTEALYAAKSDSKLQIFASDADAQAVAAAREGIYPSTIEEQVSPERLAQFFMAEERGYRILPSLRACIIFAVQDVLADPPFSRINFISCRNLMIYLQPEAQAQLIDVFHFALQEKGILLLGAAETIGTPDGRFTVMSKPARLYRKVGQGSAHSLSAPGGLGLPHFLPLSESSRALRTGPLIAPRGQDIAEMYRKLVLERYAPPAVMVNRRLECLYTSGMIGAFLHFAPGYPTHDLLSLLAPGLRARVKTGITEVGATQMSVSLPGGHITRNGERFRFSIEIQPVPHDSDKFLLFFLTQAKAERKTTDQNTPPATGQMAALERELEAVRADLQLTIRSLEISSEDQKALNEEALSINEEYQSTNEELLTSKEELQSLNEELTALNSQLQETLERSRATLSDLQNVLNSSDVATLFLDANLHIRFFTPPTTSLFAVKPGDVGRPLSDFRPRATDPSLFTDAANVLSDSQPREAEVQTDDGVWFQRRIQPYRTHEGKTAGVIVTFADITGRRSTQSALETAQNESERANLAKSRFLAAASHDLRQPLQVMRLISALLAKAEHAQPAAELVTRLDHAIDSMAEMLNALLDINQIDAGVVQPVKASFPVQDLLTTLEREFSYLASAQNLVLRVVPSSLSINSDASLLEQMLRNLLANALKYTQQGGVLLGCRHAGPNLRIEIWDTGIGIASTQLREIFEEYRQIGNEARARGQGLGLGLSIVKRLGELLGHEVRVRSWPGHGSVFSVEVPMAAARAATPAPPTPLAIAPPALAARTILLVDDDPSILHLLQSFLASEGFQVLTAPDGATALSLAATTAPDMILTDYNLPGAMNGVALVAALRKQCARNLPGVVITGDIATTTLRDIARQGCVQLNKPMKLTQLMSIIQPLFAIPAQAPHGTILVIDDDQAVRDLMHDVFEAAGYIVKGFGDCESFLRAGLSDENTCLLLDEHLPGMSGFELLAALAGAGRHLPTIMITGQGDVKMAVRAMQAGVTDFIEKPASAEDLKNCVARALHLGHEGAPSEAESSAAMAKIARLTGRQREVMERVLAGEPSKNIAADLGISQRTVENHRAAVMAKTGARSIPALARMAMKAGNGAAH